MVRKSVGKMGGRSTRGGGCVARGGAAPAPAAATLVLHSKQGRCTQRVLHNQQSESTRDCKGRRRALPGAGTGAQAGFALCTPGPPAGVCALPARHPPSLGLQCRARRAALRSHPRGAAPPAKGPQPGQAARGVGRKHGGAVGAQRVCRDVAGRLGGQLKFGQTSVVGAHRGAVLAPALCAGGAGREWQSGGREGGEGSWCAAAAPLPCKGSGAVAQTEPLTPALRGRQRASAQEGLLYTQQVEAPRPCHGMHAALHAGTHGSLQVLAPL